MRWCSPQLLRYLRRVSLESKMLLLVVVWYYNNVWIFHYLNTSFLSFLHLRSGITSNIIIGALCKPVIYRLFVPFIGWRTTNKSNRWRFLSWIRADIDQELLSSPHFDKLFQFLQSGCFYVAISIIIWLGFLLLIIAYWDLRNFICLTLDLWERSSLLWTFQPPAIKSVERSNSKLGLLLQF